MGWTPAKSAGLAVGLTLLVLAIAITAFYFFRHRNRKSKSAVEPEKPVDVESPAPSTPNQDISAPDAEAHVSPDIPHPDGEYAGTVRRTTGHTQTFTDWVAKTHDVIPDCDPASGDKSGVSTPPPSTTEPPQQSREPKPRPISAETLTLMSSLPKVSRAGEPMRAFTLPPLPAVPEPERRSSTRDSWGASSFRRAVLSAGGGERAREILAKVKGEREEARKKGGVKKEEVEEKEVEVKREEVRVKVEGEKEGRGRAYSGAWP